MTRSFLLVALLLASLTSIRAQQGGSIYLSDIDVLLQQKKPLVERITADFEIFRTGDASRISRTDNAELAGTRLGPYTLYARPKGSTGPYAYQVRVETKAVFLDSSGHKVALDKATQVREQVTDIVIRALPADQYFVPSSD